MGKTRPLKRLVVEVASKTLFFQNHTKQKSFKKQIMADTAIVAPAPVAASPAKKPKKASTGVKKPKSKPTHPPVKQLVVAAIKALKERKGSSLLAIKKYIAANNKLDADKLSPFIKRFLKKAVANGKLVQTKGKGASGSFKLPAKEKADKKPKAAKKTVKKASAKKPKKTLVKKAKSATTKAAKKSVKPKQKATKAKATAVKKLKTPKPKKVKKPAAKKVAPKKK